MKNIKYTKKLFLSWPSDMRKKLRDMTLGYDQNSGMLHSVSLGKNPITCVAFINSVPVGWSVVSDSAGPFFSKGTIMVYIKIAFRKKGIGTKLVNRLHKVNGLKAISWSKPSDYFWDKINKKTKHRLTLYYY